MPDARTVIRDRLAALQAIKENYLGYLQCRISESDWHGAWDASVNISETECEMSGLMFALNALEAEHA